jgi:urease accessory protein
VDPAGPAVRELTPRPGRDGGLQAAFARRDERTVLVARRFRTPLQLLEPVSLGDDPACWVMVLNPTGGVLAGDRLVTDLDLGPGAHLGFTTPSATRVYRSPGPVSVLETRARLGARATLEYVPDHLIPHAGARVAQTLRVDLAAGSRVVLWDAMALGRPARREWWSFASVTTAVEVRVAGRLVYVDHAHLESGRSAMRGRGGLDGLRYVATLTVVEAGRDDWDGLVRELSGCLAPGSPWRGGVSRLAGPGCVARVLADSAYDLDDVRRLLYTRTRRWLMGRGEVDLRKP